MSDVDVHKERFNSLPEIVKLFLDKNALHKETILKHGDWWFYLSHAQPKGYELYSIFSLILLPPRTRQKDDHPVYQWNLIIDDWEKFLKDWEVL